MTTITAKIIADSISPDNIRITTMESQHPRCIHAEFMTHRVFSRNSASSRAIPVKRMIQSLRDDPFVPLVWGKNQRGMQASEECNERVAIGMSREEAWLHSMELAILMAEKFDAAGYHKQIVNRLLEPWMHIKVVCTSTQWSNFFALREHKAAEPHMQLLATKMRQAYDGSTPAKIDYAEWHTPYCDRGEFAGEKWEDVIKISAARCAHVSYQTVGDQAPITGEVALRIYNDLVGQIPLHASPLEHQAMPDHKNAYYKWAYPEQWGNFHGWRQHRKMLPGECQ